MMLALLLWLSFVHCTGTFICIADIINLKSNSGCGSFLEGNKNGSSSSHSQLSKIHSFEPINQLHGAGLSDDDFFFVLKGMQQGDQKREDHSIVL